MALGGGVVKPGMLELAGQPQVQVIDLGHPDVVGLFPDGADIVVCARGGLEVLVRIFIQRPGCMLAIYPPELAAQLRAGVKEATDAQAKAAAAKMD